MEGGRYLVNRNDGTQQQDQLFVADSLEELRAGGRLLVDPNTFAEDGTASLKTYDVSRDGRLLAYQVSEGGSDWTTVRLRDAATGEDLEDELTHVKFSGATWLPDDRSFLYVHFPTAGEATGAAADPRRPLAGAAPLRGHLGEEPAVGPPGAYRRGGQPAATRCSSACPR